MNLGSCGLLWLVWFICESKARCVLGEICKKGSVSRRICKKGSVWNNIAKVGRVVRWKDDIKVKSSSQRPVSLFFLNEVVRPPAGFSIYRIEVVRQEAGFSFWFFFSLQFYFMFYKFSIFSFFNHLHFINFLYSIFNLLGFFYWYNKLI